MNAEEAQTCSSCGSLLSPNGSDDGVRLLHELNAAQEVIQHLKHYIPPPIVDGILHDEERLRGERREVAVLFADLVNFTQLSEGLDPEAVFNLLSDLLNRLAQCIHRYDGLIDKFTGDGLMAVFGAPVAHENDTELAVRAALDMQQQAAEFEALTQEELKAPIKIRIGIHSGPAIAGIIGTERQSAYTVIGQSVNLAARLEAHAQPGHILVSSRVYKQVRPFFNFRAQELTVIKGIDEPLAVYEISTERAEPMAERGIPGVPRIFLGHEKELDTLREELKGFREDGHGRIVIVRGEAGVGKTRLVSEWLERSQPEGVQVLKGRGLPYAQGTSYGIFRSLLEDTLGQKSSRARVTWESRVSPSLRPFLRRVLGLPISLNSQRRLASLEPERINQLTTLALREWVLGEAWQHPLILILEDFHWADDLSRHVFEELSQLIDDAPILFCVNSRPRHEIPIKSHLVGSEYLSSLNVPPLTREESLALLGHMVELQGLPQTTVDTILDRAEGNPFYIEEFVRMLIEKELLYLEKGKGRVTSLVDLKALEIPTSLQSLMMARTDRLPENLWRLLRVAAVVGLQFERSLLETILRQLHGYEGIEEELRALIELGFLEERLQAGTQTYAFRNILTQETIYTSILRSQRPQLHKSVAEAIEFLHQGDLADQLEVLALHYHLAEEKSAALNYALLAGEQARQQFANQQAIEYYRRAKKLATEEPGRKEELWQATVGLGEIQVHIGEYDEAIHSYREALDSWPEAPLEERIKVMLRLGRAWNRRGDTEEAINWLFRASKELEELDLRLPALEGELYDELGWVIVRRGEFDRAEAWLQKGIAAVEEGNHPHLVASLHNHLGAVCFQKGELEQATEHVSRSLALREQLGDIVGVARSYNNLGILRRTSHDWEGALQSYQRGLELLERIGDTEGTIIAHTNIGNLFIERQEWDKAEENLLESLITAQCIRHGYELAQANMNLGRLYLLQEQLEAGAHHLHAALPLYEEAGGTTSSGLLDAHHWLSILHLKLDQLDEAQAWADRSHELLERLQGSSSSFLWGRYEQLLGQILMAEGKFAEAVKHLERSDEIYQSAAPVVDQGEIAYHLAQAYLALGRGRESDAQLERAQELYESVNAEAKIQEVESLRNEAQDRKRETEPRAAEA